MFELLRDIVIVFLLFGGTCFIIGPLRTAGVLMIVIALKMLGIWD